MSFILLVIESYTRSRSGSNEAYKRLVPKRAAGRFSDIGGRCSIPLKGDGVRAHSRPAASLIIGALCQPLEPNATVERTRSTPAPIMLSRRYLPGLHLPTGSARLEREAA